MRKDERFPTDQLAYIETGLSANVRPFKTRRSPVLSGESLRMTRERWRTKLRRQPRRGAESVRSSHAVDFVGRRVSPPPHWGECSHLRRRFAPNLPKKQASAPTAPRRRYPPFDPRGVHGMTTTNGIRASARPPPQLRTPMFARHSRQIATQNRAPGRFEGPESWRPRASGPPSNAGRRVKVSVLYMTNSRKL